MGTRLTKENAKECLERLYGSDDLDVRDLDRQVAVVQRLIGWGYIFVLDEDGRRMSCDHDDDEVIHAINEARYLQEMN